MTTLYVIYLDEHKQPTQATVTVDLRHPWSKLKLYRYVYPVFTAPGRIKTRDYFDDKESAEEWLQRAARLVRFVNASGLRPVHGTRAHKQIAVPDWSDHQTFWIDEFGNLFILIEPMDHRASYVKELDANQFTSQMVPRPLSIYHSPEYIDGFSMLLATHGNKDRLSAVIAQLQVAATQLGTPI